MIIYSWKKVYKESGGKSKEIVYIINWLTYRPKLVLIGNRFRFYDKIDWSGESFLKNPEDLLTHCKRYHVKDVAEYIALASFRSYGKYKLDHDTTLALIQCPVDEAIIQNNKLLSIVGDRVHFKWEV